MDPEAIWPMIHELHVHQIELEMQNDELRRAQAELDISRARYLDFYELAPVGYLTIGAQGLILQANLIAASLLGVDISKLLNQPFFRCIFKEDQGIFHQLSKQLAKTGKAQSCELRMVKGDGTVFWSQLDFVAAQEDGAPVTRVLFSDITTRKNAVEALHKSEELFRLIVQSAEEGIWKIDANSLTDYINPKMAQMMGYTVKEMLGRPIDDFLDDEGRAMLGKLIQRRKDGIAEQFEFKYLRKDGSELWALVSTNPITNADGTYVGAVALLTDNTARREAEKALRESEERYKLLADHADDFVGLYDTAGNSLYLSPSYYRKTGWTVEDLKQKDWRTRIHPEDHETIEHAHAANMVGRASRIEHRNRCKDGSWLWFETNTKPIFDGDGKVWRLLFWSHDITERKQAEAALRESEAQFRAIFEQAAVGVAMIDSNTGRFLKVNQRACEIAHHTREQMLNETFMDLTHPDDLHADLELMEKLRAGVISTFTLEKRYLHANGQITWINLTVSPMWQPGEVPTRHIAVVEDITLRKQSELELAHTSDLLQRTGAVAKIGGWELDLKTRQLVWSLETCRLFEIDDSVAPSLEEAISFYALEARPQIQAAIQAAIDHGTPYDLELRVISAKARSFWARSQGVPVLDGDKVVKLIGTFQDITERKLAEASYRRELEFNQTLANHTSVIILMLDAQGKIMHVNDATVRLLGFSRKELVGRKPWEFLVSAAEQAVAGVWLQKMINGKSNPPREVTLTGKKGTQHIVSMSSVSTRLPDGALDRIIVTGTDLTERNQLQREILKISEQEQARIGHNLHDGIGQTMTGVASLMESLESELSGTQRKSAERIREILQDALQEVRRMSHGLSPSAVKNRGLGGALQLLAETIRINHRTACTCEVDPAIQIGDAEKESHIFRIAQEAANNAIRHGHPKKVAISLRHFGTDECVLMIENDGLGITKKKGKTNSGIGLQVMDYRANLIGGTLKVVSKPRRGVSVSCRFPCVKVEAKKPGKAGA